MPVDLSKIPSSDEEQPSGVDLSRIPSAGFEAPKVPSQTIGDYAKRFAEGTVDTFVTAPGAIAEAAGGPAQFRQSGQAISQAISESRTPQSQALDQTPLFDDDWNLSPNPVQKIASGVIQSAPSFIQAGVLGRPIQQAMDRAGVAGKVAAGASAIGVPAKAGKFLGNAVEALPFAAIEGAAAGGMSAADMLTQIEDAPIETLRASPRFNELLAGTDASLPPAQREAAARQALKIEAAREVGAKTAAWTGGVGFVTQGGALGPIARRLSGKGGPDGFFKAVGKGYAQEMVQEAPQSAGETYFSNVGKRDYLDASQDPWEGVGQAGVEGGIIGGFTGGAASAATYRSQPQAPVAPPVPAAGPISNAVRAGQQSGAIPTNPVGGPVDVPATGVAGEVATSGKASAGAGSSPQPGKTPVAGSADKQTALAEIASVAGAVPPGSTVPPESEVGKQIALAANRAAMAGATPDEIAAAQAGQVPAPSAFAQRQTWKSLAEVEAFVGQQAPDAKPVQREDKSFTFALPGEPEYDALPDARQSPDAQAARDKEIADLTGKIGKMIGAINTANTGAKKARENGNERNRVNAERIAAEVQTQLDAATARLAQLQGGNGADARGGAVRGAVLGTAVQPGDAGTGDGGDRGPGADLGGRAEPAGAALAGPDRAGGAPEIAAAAAGNAVGTRPVVFQNRDRSKAASVTQMAKIAGNPDPRRLSFSREFGTGAPVVFANADAAGIPGEQQGADSEVVDADGKSIPIRYAVVEAGEVVASNRADGTPDDLYGDSDTPGLIRVVSGNGRLAGLQEAYNRGTTAGYIEGIAADSVYHGVNPDVIRAMVNPVLVRLMRSADVTPDIGDRSNVSGISQLSPVEQARTDMARVNLDGLEFHENGSPTMASVKRFVQAMPASEQSGLMTADGAPGTQAIDRLMAATFAKAYGDTDLIELYAQATDPEARNVISALAQSAGPMSRLEGAGDLDIRPAVLEAVRAAVNASRRGTSLAKFSQQRDFDVSPEAWRVVEHFVNNARSAKRMAEGLRNLATAAYSEAQKGDTDMFGAVPKRTGAQIISEVFDGQQREGDADADANAGRPGLDEEGAGGPGRREGERAPASDAGQPSDADRPADGQAGDFDLVAPTREDILRRQEAAEQARQADAAPDEDFVLAGSNRPVDQARARGQMEIGGEAQPNVERDGALLKTKQGVRLDPGASAIDIAKALVALRAGSGTGSALHRFLGRGADRILASENVAAALGREHPERAAQIAQELRALDGDQFESQTGAPRALAGLFARLIEDGARHSQRPVDAAPQPESAASPVNDRPLHAGATDDTLVLMACSETKADVTGKVPLLDLYTGPLWTSLKTNRDKIPADNVFAFSGKHGFKPASFASERYEERLTPEKARAAAADAQALAQLVKRDRPWRNVIIVGSSEYRTVFDAIVTEAQKAGALAEDVAIVAPDGAGVDGKRGGIGLQRMRLNKALSDVNGAAPKAAKPKSKTALLDEARTLVRTLRGAGLGGLAQGLSNRLTPGKVPPGSMIRTEADLAGYYDLLARHRQEADKPAGSTAPEHANLPQGASEADLKKIVKEFNDAQAATVDAEFKVTHVFDPPAKNEVVRLETKTRVQVGKSGWMTPAEAKARIAEWKEHAQAQGETLANSEKVVLSLFDLSGEWSKPWEEAGYQVFRFDIQDDPEVGDINNFSTEFFADWFGAFDGMDVYAVLGACPCTDFASSGARHFAAKDKDGRTVSSVKLVHQTLATIEFFKPAVWAIENPVGRIESLTGLPPWRLSFDPNHLGDPYTKKTLLWGRFNGDLPVAPVEPTEGSKMWSKYGGKSLATKNARSVTPEGFAYGFFMANNAIDHPLMAIANKYDRLDRGALQAALDAGLNEQAIGEIVDDFYYMDLDDDAANAALREAAGAGKKADPRNDKDAGYSAESTKAGYAVTQAKAVREAIQGVGKKKDFDEKQLDALTKWIAKRPDAARIVANLKEHRGTPWARQSLEGALTRAAIEEYVAGRTPEFDSFLNAPTAVGLRTLLERNGADGAWQYLSREGVVGNSAKPVNSVSSSFIDCNPSKDCATFCYAAKGNFAFGASVRKSELMTWAAENDPVRLGRLMAGEYASTLEFQHQKALRLFDKGDGTDAWVAVIEEVNKHTGPDGKPAPIRVQVFSKNPEFLRKVPAMNLRMLSVDKSNVEVARANPDLPVAFVYTDPSQVEFLSEIKDRVQVILPVKQGAKLLDQDKIDALPKWTKPVVCPVDDGRVTIGKNRFKKTDTGSVLVTDKGEWNCTRCDKNGGVGCFHGSTTDKAIAAFTKPVHTRSDDEVNKILDDLRAVSGRLAPRERAEFLGSLDSLVSAIRAGIDIGTEGTGRAGDAARVGADDGWKTIRITRRRDAEKGGQDDEGLTAEAPRRKYKDDPQLSFDYELDPSQAGPAGEAAKRAAVAAVDDLRSTGNVLALALSSDLAARQRATLVGQVVKNTEDFATLAQVYRDPRFETFRTVFVDDKGKIVAQVGVTQRMPASAKSIVGNDGRAYFKAMSAAAKQKGATGYYLLHNHPGGAARASGADVDMTVAWAAEFKGLEYKSHVIIDTNEYATIDRGGYWETHKKDFGQSPTFVANEWSNTIIGSADDLMAIAKKIEADKDAVTLITMTYQNQVTGITTLPSHAFTESRGRNRMTLHRHGLKHKGNRIVAVSSSMVTLRKVEGLVLDGIYLEKPGKAISLANVGAARIGDLYADFPRRDRLSPDTSPEFRFLNKFGGTGSKAAVAQDRAAYNATTRVTENKNFSKWFGDSKVVDANGEPLVVYHGGTFDERSNGVPGGLMWFTSDKTDAREYARSVDGRVASAYLSIRNPRIVKPGEETNRILQQRQSLIEQGYDGVHDPEVGDWVAFRPEQIKSAIGNEGTFDPANPDIRFSRAVEWLRGPLGWGATVGNRRAQVRRVTMGDGSYQYQAIVDGAAVGTAKSVAEAKKLAEARLAPAASRGDGDGLPIESVTKMADAISKAWANGPKVVVVSDMTDPKIPEAVRRVDSQQRSGGAAGDVEGFYDKGVVYLMAGQLTSAADVARVMQHEALGHYGLRGVFGTRLGEILDQIANVRRADVEAKRKAYGLPDTAQGRRVAAEEVLAVMAQTKPEMGFVRRAIAAIRQWFRDATGIDLALSDNDIIAQFIVPARRFVERGGQPGAGGATAFQRVWHGSPHRFDRFSTNAIGTGEGAQAYGWGLYFAGLRDVAEHYRNRLAGDNSLLIDGKRPEFDMDGPQGLPGSDDGRWYNLALLRLQQEQSVEKALDHPGDFPQVRAEVARLAPRVTFEQAGRLYEAEIPEDNEFLLWDKNLSEQPEKVKQALAKWEDAPDKEVWGTGYWTGERMYEGNVNVRVSWDGKGRSEAQRDVSLGLLKAGIRGIKYLDGNSRHGDGKSFNYVVFSDNDVEIAAAFSRKAPVWYSPLAKAVEAINAKAQPAQSWLGQINALTSKGIKPDEIEWSGVREWLAMQEGKVAKADVQAFLEANGVRVEETVLSEQASLDVGEEFKRAGYEISVHNEGEVDESTYYYDSDRNEVEFDDLPANLQRLINGEPAARTKFGGWVVKGGTNYREILLTLPVREVRQSEAWINAMRQQGPFSDDASLLRNKAEPQIFRSGHWDQPNVLAHVRIDERTDADGKRVLFVQEIQSDWAQKGRKEGFAGPTITKLPDGFTTEKAEVAVGEGDRKMAVQEEYERVLDAMTDAYNAAPEIERAALEKKDEAFQNFVAGVPGSSGMRARRNSGYNASAPLPNPDAPVDAMPLVEWARTVVPGSFPESLFAANKTKAEWRVKAAAGAMEGATQQRSLLNTAHILSRGRTEKEAVQKALNVLNSKRSAIPSAPFVEKTDAWVALALKRIVRLAAEEGFDRVAIISGEQAARTFQLSAHVESLTWRRTADGQYDVGGTTVSGELRNFGIHPEDKLPDLVGKELAERIVNARSRVPDPADIALLAKHDIAPAEWGAGDVQVGDMPADAFFTSEGMLTPGEFFDNGVAVPREVIDAAMRVVSAREGRNRLEGVDMVVGGEGMRGFYDGIVPIALKKVLKGVGGAPTTVTIGGAAVGNVYQGNKQVASNVTRDQYDNEWGDGYRFVQMNDPSAGLEQPGFDISPAMRDTVMDQGMPMFARRPTVAGVQAAVGEATEAIRGARLNDVWRSVKNAWTDKRGAALSLMGRMQIADVYGDMLPGLRDYSAEMDRYDADKNEVAAQADEIVGQWAGAPDGAALADTMHEATLLEFDPEYMNATTDEEQALKDRFDALSAEAKAVYIRARDAYEAHWNNVKAAIQGRIERADIAESQRREMMEAYRDQFLQPRRGPYFPLARFGDYVLTATNAEGNRVVVFAETMGEAQREQARMRSAESGLTEVSKILRRKEYSAARDSVSKDFVRQLFEAVDRSTTDSAEATLLKDSINQLYLTSLPDVSWAKHGIHRKGTPGFNRDARRAFAANMFHGGYYLSKLEHADILQDYLRAMQEGVESQATNESYDSVAGQQVVDEMVKRHDKTMNPDNAPWANKATAVGFVWFLGLSPASAIVNLSQTALVAYPIIAARFGFGKTADALTRASADTMKARNNLRGRLRGDEATAFDKAAAEGVIDLTQAHDLAAISEGRDSQLHGIMSPVMKVAAYLFHHAERFNRQATFMAAYRLAKDAGEAPNVAYETAKDMTYKGHFNYSSSNRPRAMMGPVARVLLLFKQYGQNMVYTLGRNAYLSLPRIGDAATRAEARKALAGILVAHGLTAGTLGLPLSSVLLGLASIIGGSDDEPWDAEVAFRNYLADAVGKDMGEVIAKGVFRALLPGDISNRVGLQDLLIRDVDLSLDPNQVYNNLLHAALGPVVGIGLNAARGASALAGGDVLRGVEGFLPKAIADGVKTIRYGTEGVKDRSGVDVVDDVAIADLISQVTGFSPARVREAYDARRAVQGQKRALDNRRENLLRDFSRSVINQDHETRLRTLQEIQHFNLANPITAIKPESMLRSVQTRMRRQAEAKNGIYLPRKQRDLADLGRFANVN